MVDLIDQREGVLAVCVVAQVLLLLNHIIESSVIGSRLRICVVVGRVISELCL